MKRDGLLSKRANPPPTRPPSIPANGTPTCKKLETNPVNQQATPDQSHPLYRENPREPKEGPGIPPFRLRLLTRVEADHRGAGCYRALATNGLSGIGLPACPACKARPGPLPSRDRPGSGFSSRGRRFLVARAPRPGPQAPAVPRLFSVRSPWDRPVVPSKPRQMFGAIFILRCASRRMPTRIGCRAASQPRLPALAPARPR